MTDIPSEVMNRKGARKAEDIPAQVLDLLQAGIIETVNLTEWLATDQLEVLKMVLSELGQDSRFAEFEAAVSAQKKPTANSNTKVIGHHFGTRFSNEQVFKHLREHASDIVRCWACWAEGVRAQEVPTLLKTMKPYAADTHFGVREVVIFASKDQMIAELETSVGILTEWTASEDENVRRYAVESLRPIGVWTKKIEAFQVDPSLGLSLLEPLKSDPSKYVQNSVANWLNDASKSQPDWVQSVCDTWSKHSNSKETAYIVKRALRTINK
ncbi:MAG: DNA alkylation repair protein [Bacteroidota bacterium]